MNIIKSQILPIRRSDIDTDLIIPADFLTTTVKEGLGMHVFDRLRKADVDFPMNLVKYSKAKILVVRHNFGCGSSREHAAWALKDWGIEVVIAPSFADIFYSNAMKNGILPVVLEETVVEKIFAQEDLADTYEIEVNLSKNQVILPDSEVFNFELDPYRKECLMKGMEDLDYLLANLNAIEKFDRRHSKEIFFYTSNL